MFLYLFFSTWICPGFTLQPEGIPYFGGAKTVDSQNSTINNLAKKLKGKQPKINSLSLKKLKGKNAQK